MIVGHQKSAMKRHHSKLLVCETVIPDVECSGLEALADISGITFSSVQRSVGLEIVKIWPPSARGGPFSLLEAEVAADA